MRWPRRMLPNARPMRSAWGHDARDHGKLASAQRESFCDAGGCQWSRQRIAAISKFLRLALQVGVLGTAAWLHPRRGDAGRHDCGEHSDTREAPVDQAIGRKAFVAARAAYRRVAKILTLEPAAGASIALPEPSVRYGVKRLVSCTEVPVIATRLHTGGWLGLGHHRSDRSGKTTLARLLVGNLSPATGHARIDGIDVAQWQADERGQHIGYLPQTVELLTDPWARTSRACDA